MLCTMDTLKDIHKKKFYLAYPDETIISPLNDITNKKGVLKLTPYSEVSFSITKTKENKDVYDKITKLQKILIEDIGWFILNEPSISSDGKTETKSCTMYSDEYGLSNRLLQEFYLNTNEPGSIGNVTDGFVMFYDADNPELSALDLVLEKFPTWKVGYVHPLLANQKAIGSFSVESQDGYSFLINDLANAAECIFIFDNLEHTVSAYPWSQFGEIFDVYLSHKTVIEDLKCSPVDESSLVTALRVEGADGLSIREVNGGFDYIYDFSYYYDKMPEELVTAWKSYQEILNENIESYRTAIVTYTKNQEEIQNLQNLLPLEADSEDYTEYGIIPLTTLLTNVNSTIQNYEDMGLNASDSEYFDDYQQLIEKRNAIQTEKSNKESRKAELELQSTECLTNLESIANLISWENNFSEEQISALSCYIREGNYTDSTFLTTDIFTYDQTIQKKWELKEYALDRLSEMARPQYSITTTINNLAEIPEYASIRNKVSLGHFITIMFNEFIDIPLRLMSLSFEFDNISNISVEYSNMKRSRNGISDLAYLLDNSTGTVNRSSSSSGGSGGGSGSGSGSGGSGDGDYVTRSELKTQLFNLSLGGSGSGSGAAFSSQEIAYLNSLVNGKFNTLEGNFIVTKVLEADEATIGQLTTTILNSDYADIDTLVGNTASFKVINTDLENVKNLLAGNVGTGTLQAIHINASNAVFDEAFIKEGIAAKMSIADLSTHTSSSELITIVSSETGNPTIAFKDSTQQFYDSEGNVRVQIGQDASGNFNFIIRGSDGTTALFDENGITKEGITDGMIVNNMISDGTIQKDKLGFEVIESNEQGGIDISKVYLGDKGFFAEYTTFKEDITKKVEDTTVYKLELESTGGISFTNGNIDTYINVTLYRGTAIVTDEFDDSNFIWTRQSVDETSDTYWNQNHSTGSKTIHITSADVLKNASFKCSFFIDDELVVTSEQI